MQENYGNQGDQFQLASQACQTLAQVIKTADVVQPSWYQPFGKTTTDAVNTLEHLAQQIEQTRPATTPSGAGSGNNPNPR